VAWTAHAAAPTAAGARTLRREDHLQHLVWIFEEILEFVALRSEHFLRQLRGDLDARDGRVFRHVTDFVHFDGGVARERGLQLFRQRRGFGVSAREGAHKSRELRLR
jgi:hypothetical protein